MSETITIKLPTRIAIPRPNPGQPATKPVDARELLQTMVMTLPFWRAGTDIKRLDAQAAILDALDVWTKETNQVQLTAGQKELLAQAMEAPNAHMPDQEINRLFSATLRAVLAAE